MTESIFFNEEGHGFRNAMNSFFYFGGPHYQVKESEDGRTYVVIKKDDAQIQNYLPAVKFLYILAFPILIFGIGLLIDRCYTNYRIKQEREILFEELGNAKDLETARSICARSGFEVGLLNERENKSLHKFSPAEEAFYYKRYDVANYYISLGGAFHLNARSNEINKPSLFFEFPFLSEAVCEAKLRCAINGDLRKEIDGVYILNFILDEACHKGNLRAIDWVLKKLEEHKIPISKMELDVAVRNAISGGFDYIIEKLAQKFDLRVLEPEKKDDFIKKCLDSGFPNLISMLSRAMDVHLTEEQVKEMDGLIEKLQSTKEEFEKELEHAFPTVINAAHDKMHGGQSNEDVYRREYINATIYALNYIRTNAKNCNFERLISNLADRRRRMAVLGNLSPLDRFGIRETNYSVTPYGKSYASYGERIREKYKGRLPHQINYKLNGISLSLTTISDSKWEHPYGFTSDQLMPEIARMCKELISTSTADGKHVITETAKILSLFSHAAPFSRGTPTIIYMLIDALMLYQGYQMIDKKPDLNCEALMCDEAEFVQYLLEKCKDHPKIA